MPDAVALRGGLGTVGRFSASWVWGVEKIAISGAAVANSGIVQEAARRVGSQSIGASAGSLLVFKGKYRAVLVSYPSRKETDGILCAAARDSRA